MDAVSEPTCRTRQSDNYQFSDALQSAPRRRFPTSGHFVQRFRPYPCCIPCCASARSSSVARRPPGPRGCHSGPQIPRPCGNKTGPEHPPADAPVRRGRGVGVDRVSLKIRPFHCGSAAGGRCCLFSARGAGRPVRSAPVRTRTERDACIEIPTRIMRITTTAMIMITIMTMAARCRRTSFGCVPSNRSWWARAMWIRPPST